MRLKKSRDCEAGYLLLENMVALSIIAALLILVYPLIADWLMIREAAKHEVEQTRVLYELSMHRPNQSAYHSSYEIYTSNAQISVTYENKTIGVEIYGSQFE